MRDFLLEFERRRAEVRRYIAVLLLCERRLGGGSDRRHEEELKIFRAGALLIIYNAVEASARLGVLAIYDEISRSNTSFDDLRESFRVRVLHDFKNVGSAKYGKLRDIAFDLIRSGFDPEKVFPGNVDARKIREIAKIYGFSASTEYTFTKNGDDLLTVKNRRQHLAHGTHSFSDVGREYSTEDIVRIGRYSLAYMSEILRHIDTYLEVKGYRECPESESVITPPPIRMSWTQRAREWSFQLLRLA